MLGIRARVRNYIRRIVDEAVVAAKDEVASPTQEILACAHGHARSLKSRRPEAANGLPLPWYTYPAIEYCSQFDVTGLDLFEYGSGNSSLFWAHRGANVWCVEHDREWYESMRIKSAQLRGITLRESAEAYASAIGELGRQFDIVIVDGAWRNECAEQAIRYVKNDGLLIVDNTDWYTDVAQFLQARGYFQVDFNGFGPVNNYCWTTSIFLPFHSPFMQRLRQPQPIGGIEVFKGERW